MPWKRREALTRGREENTKKRGRQSRTGQGRYPRRSGGLGRRGGKNLVNQNVCMGGSK